jgi:hypothetical protein
MLVTCGHGVAQQATVLCFAVRIWCVQRALVLYRQLQLGCPWTFLVCTNRGSQWARWEHCYMPGNRLEHSRRLRPLPVANRPLCCAWLCLAVYSGPRATICVKQPEQCSTRALVIKACTLQMTYSDDSALVQAHVQAHSCHDMFTVRASDACTMACQLSHAMRNGQGFMIRALVVHRPGLLHSLIACGHSKVLQ